MTSERIRTYREFWPYYLSQHAKAKTRWFHAIGTLGAMAIVIVAIVTGHFRLIPLALVSVYAIAWYSHFFIEKNRPATFDYPFWSFLSDFRMLWWMLTGKL